MATRIYQKDPAGAKAFLTNYTNMTAQSTFDTWKRLGEFIVVKYADGVIRKMKDGKFERNSIVSLPVWFVRVIRKNFLKNI